MKKKSNYYSKFVDILWTIKFILCIPLIFWIFAHDKSVYEEEQKGD